MILYRLVRYFIFLFLIVFTILYLLRSVIPPVSQLAPIFAKIDNIYDETSQNVENTSIEEGITEKFQQYSKILFQEQRGLIKDFLQDISLQIALESIFNRNFNDLNYLINTYLAHNSSFKDVMVYQNNKLIYKYNNHYNSSSIVFYNIIPVSSGTVSVEFVFDQSILQTQLDELDELFFVKNNNKIWYPSKYDDIDSNVINKILEIPALFEGKEILQRDKALYSYMITNDLKNPFNVFILYQESFGWNSIIRGLLYLLFPLCWLIIIILDRILYRYFIKRSKNMRQKKQFNDIKEENIEDSWDWVDRFIKIENLLDDDVSYKEKELNDTLEYQKQSDINDKEF